MKKDIFFNDLFIFMLYSKTMVRSIRTLQEAN